MNQRKRSEEDQRVFSLNVQGAIESGKEKNGLKRLSQGGRSAREKDRVNVTVMVGCNSHDLGEQDESVHLGRKSLRSCFRSFIC